MRGAIDADPVLRTRVDTMVGTEFSLRQQPLDALLLRYLVEPVILISRGYALDQEVFDRHFARLDAALRADTVGFVEFIPLAGFTSHLAELALPGGLALRPMSDRQISQAIQFLAIPVEFGSGPTSVEVSRFHQWAVTREQDYPVHSYKAGMPEHPRGPAFPSLEEPARGLVTALRIICGGSTVATRPIYAPLDENAPPAIEGSAVRSAVGIADIDRPTLLITEQADAVREVYQALATTATRQDRSLQVALRRFVDSGSNKPTEDRLVDLVICCEALFVKRRQISGPRKGAPIAEHAAHLLADDPVLRVDHAAVHRFVTAAYKRRNAEVHGEPPEPLAVTLLDGSTTADLARLVDDLALLVGRALHLTLNGPTARPAPPGQGR